MTGFHGLLQDALVSVPPPVPDSTPSPLTPAAVHDGEVGAASARAWWGVVILLVLTLGSLTLAWLWPDATLMHFWWVAQAVPVLYLVLIAWGVRVRGDDDVG